MEKSKMTFTLTKLPEKEKQKKSEEFTLTKPPKEASMGRQTARGIGQGALDVLSLAGLGLYPFEKLSDMASTVETESGVRPELDEKFSREFGIMDRMEKEGYVPSYGEMLQLTDDDFGYGGGSTLGAIQQLHQEIPEGGVYQEAIRRGTRSLPFAALGGLPGVLGAEYSGLAAKEGVKALGGGETVQTVADIGAGLVWGLKDFFTKGGVKAAEEVVPFVAQKKGGIMQAIEKQAPKSLEKRLHSLSTEIIDDFGKEINKITDKEIQQLSQFSAREIEDAIVKEASSKALDKITTQDVLPQKAWKDIQEGANKLFEAEQAAYTSLYQNVRESAKKIVVQPEKSISTARDVLKKLTNVKTSPSGYSQTANIVRDVLHDLTGISPNVEIIQSAMETGNTKLLDSIYESLTNTTKMKADKLMDLSIRLNDAINYETLIPNIKNFLKPLQRTIKEELKETLGKSAPNKLQMLNDADTLYKKTADRFGKDVISTLRKSESPEKLNTTFSQPSNFENLLKVFGPNSPQIRHAERQIISDIGSMSTKSANELFRQIEPFLSKKAKDAGKEVISMGDKLSVPGQRRALQQSMLENVAESISTGQPPNFTTRAMLTPQGYQTAKDTFSRSKSGREVFKTLEKKLVSDIFDSIIVNDQIDWAKAAKILDNPNTATVMNEIIGTEGIAMMKNMQKYGENISSNLGNLKTSQPSFYNQLISKMDSPTKLFLAAVVGKAIALPLWLTTGFAAAGLKNSLASIITNQKALKALKNLGNSSELSKAPLNDINVINASITE
jgi:hypothetical protein